MRTHRAKLILEERKKRMNQFTEGPWKPEIENDIYGLPDLPDANDLTGWIRGSNDENIVEYRDCGSHRAQWNNSADLRLACAAPELFKAVSELLEVCDEFRIDGDVIINARIALAKARGQS